MGKSSICKQVAREEQIGFSDMRLASMDPTDLRGIPVPENGSAKWLPPEELPREGRGILLLDEINLAPPLIQASAYPLVFGNTSGKYTLPAGWRVIAAGNKLNHGAHVYKMAFPLRNRFTHIDFELDIDHWREWAFQNKIATEVIEYLAFRPDHLFQFDPKRDENAFPTPRSWEFVSNILKQRNGLDQTIIMELVRGTVGPGVAVEFQTYLDLRATMPSLDRILAGENIATDGNTDIACALVAALAARAEPAQFNRLLEYSEILTPEVAVLLGKFLIMKDKQAVLACTFWPAWSRKRFDLIRSVA